MRYLFLTVVGGAAVLLQRANLDLRLVNLFDRRYHEHLVEGISGRELPAPGRGLIVGLNGSF